MEDSLGSWFAWEDKDIHVESIKKQFSTSWKPLENEVFARSNMSKMQQVCGICKPCLVGMQSSKNRIWRKVDIELMVVNCCVIWFSKNKFYIWRKRIDPKISAANAESILEAYHRVRQTKTTHIDNHRKEKRQKWIPPPKQLIFTRVCYNYYSCLTSSLTIKLSQLTNCYTLARKLSSVLIVTILTMLCNIGKAEAVEWGLQVAKEVAISSLIIESDCKEVELVNNTKSSRTTIHWIILDI